jgi:hypothetical protein
MCSILWYPAYTQTGTETVYCLPISEARLLVADALRLRQADSMLVNRSARISLLEQQMESDHQSFTNLLKIESEKLKVQKEITSDMARFSDSFKEELSYTQKKSRKFKRQRNVLGVLLVVVIGLAAVK